MEVRGCSLRLWRFEVKEVEVEGCSLRLMGCRWKLRGCSLRLRGGGGVRG